jgi:hypothetical protein
MAENAEYSQAILVAKVVLDEIKIFNKALSKEQLLLDMSIDHGIASGIC